jgi:signal transduction histidine kinase
MMEGRGLRALLWPGGVALGLLAEWVGYGFADPRRWVPDIATGWTLGACGLVAWSRRPDSETGALLTATGFAWFAGNFAHAGLGVVDIVAAHAIYLHRGPLIHVVQTHPGRVVRGRLDRAMVAVGYAAAAVTPVWQSPRATIALGAAVAVVPLRRHLLERGSARRVHLPALRAGVLLGGVLVAGAISRHTGAGGADELALLAYELVLCVIAVDLLASLVGRWLQRAAVSDIAVELGESGWSGTLRDALAQAVGDPTLVVGYRMAGTQSYVDDDGRPIEPPDAAEGRRATTIERDGQVVTVVVHDAAVLDDPAFAKAFAAAASLAGRNAELQAERRRALGELVASRERLLRAGDSARRKLERELREGGEGRLSRLSPLIDRAAELAQLAGAKETGDGLARARARLFATLADLRQLASGLQPRTLAEQGLAAALCELVERCPLTVTTSVSDRPLSPDIGAVIYFVCSEALANTIKHAPESAVTLTVEVIDNRALVRVSDDGPGGADPEVGSGLRGMIDRVEAAGGALRIRSPVGGGTDVICELPVVSEPWLSPTEG